MDYKFSFGFGGAPEDTRVETARDCTRFYANADSDDAAYFVSLTLHAPIKDTYIMIPACAYDGNRFEAVHRRYPPMLNEDELGEDAPPRMTEVPRLSPQGDSLMEVTTGDMAAPCVCVLNKAEKQSFLLFFDQQAGGLNLGVTLRQCKDALTITLAAPAKRGLVYRWYDGYPSLRANPTADKPLCVRAGAEIAIRHQAFTAECDSISALYKQFFEQRARLFSAQAPACLPYSEFFKQAQAELNADNYMEEYGLYALSARDGRDKSVFGQWQSGWVGGGMNTLPLICDGNARSRERAISTLKFAARYQSEFGLYYGIVFNGEVHHDCFGHFGSKYNMLLIRKHADLTYFMFKQLIALEKLGISAPAEIKRSALKAADALCGIWLRHGQLGQFVNAETGEIVIGGTAAGGIAPAALVAAYMVTGADKYLSVAREIAARYQDTALARGITNGGPGEILEAPDSESIAGLLESYALLSEQDGAQWLAPAQDAARQMASWIVPYDYKFPDGSRFNRMGILSAGSVWANVQNKHSAPGMCTLSPAAYLRLFRSTGDAEYLNVMRQVARFMPQVASRADRPMGTVQGFELKPGEICERVNLSDWEGVQNVGDSIFGASSWPETSLMLTCLEIPGVYVLPERNIVCASDHVSARLEGGRLVVENHTAYAARVKVMIETRDALKQPLGLWWQDRFINLAVAAGGTSSLTLGG